MRLIYAGLFVLALGLAAGITLTLYLQSNPSNLAISAPTTLAAPQSAPADERAAAADEAAPSAASGAPAGVDTRPAPSGQAGTAAQAGPRVAGRTAQANSDAVIAVYEGASPAVVNINFTSRQRDAFGRIVQQQGSGSGFVIDGEGHIVTNHHVAGGATRLDVTLANGDSYTGDLIGTDTANDLAIVKLNAPPAVLASLTTVPLGDSSAVRVGETVLAIGNPFGLERSASMGIVSSLARTRPGETDRLISNMIQTDAAINPGNSGGPLLNLNGEVIGINEQIETSVQGNIGIGFAVPVNALKRFLPDMLAGREPNHAWLGISGSRLTPTLAEQFNLPIKQGVIIATALPGGPAAQAGLRGTNTNNLNAADIITAIDGHAMRTVEDIIRYIDDRNPGETVRVTLLRGGNNQNVNVVLGVWPTSGAPIG